MKTTLTVVLASVFGNAAFGQIGINTAVPIASLDIATSLPDAADRILKTRNGAELLGSQGGNNNMTNTRSNLPDINLTGLVSGIAESAGAHIHTS